MLSSLFTCNTVLVSPSRANVPIGSITSRYFGKGVKAFHPRRIPDSREWEKFRRYAQGPVARSLVSANRWLRDIKTYKFSWYLTPLSPNHASTDPGHIDYISIGTKIALKIRARPQYREFRGLLFSNSVGS